jgi:hypothetical protein
VFGVEGELVFLGRAFIFGSNRDGVSQRHGNRGWGNEICGKDHSTDHRANLAVNTRIVVITSGIEGGDSGNYRNAS